jgi:PAS domain S-box-containing protein
VTGDAETQVERDRLATAVEQATESVVITDAEARIVYVNPAFERMTGYSRAEVIGANPRILKSGIQSTTFYDAMWAALSNGLPWVADMTNRRKDGTLFQEEAVFTPIRRADGAIDGYVAVKRDVTRERALEAAGAAAMRERGFILETLRSLPVGMPLEASGQAVCQQVVSMTGLTHAHLFLFGDNGRAYPVGLATADGRTADDDRLSEARTSYLRERAAVGPWLEDWSPSAQHPYSDLLRGLGVRGAAYAPVRSDGAVIGVLIAGAQTEAATSTLSALLPGLIDFADVAGALLSPMLALAAASDQARDRLHAVISSQAFHAVFQPIVDLSTGVAVGYEALTRFRDGTSPDLAFAEARRLGMGLELERATLRRAVAAAVALPAAAFLSLNVSPALVGADGGLASLLPDDARPVVLEVTEHESIPDYEAFRQALAAVGDDIGLAVDDAGAGVANFDHLVGLRPTFIKVDAALVRGVDRDLARQALIVALRHFAEATDARVIAEGIETDDELRCLVGLGVELGQGYLLGRPGPAGSWRAVDRS